MRSKWAGLGFAVLAAACGSNDSTAPVAVVATKYLVSASAASANPGGLVTVTAQLATAAGAAVAKQGVSVGWISSGTSGSFSAPSSLTNASGVATVVFTTSLTTGTIHTVTALDSSGNSGVSGSIMVTGMLLQSVVGGGYHTCGLNAAGAAFCWGQNAKGQLGDGTTTDRSKPVAVSGGLTFQSLTTGDFHTCGLTTAGVAYCWGYNSGTTGGQLGDSTKIDRTVPTLVHAAGRTFQSIAAARFHTCALTTAGAAFCWGSNGASSGYGQLGDGTLTDRLTPVAVTGGHVFTSIVAANVNTCGLTAAGAAFCWGNNFDGELGDGTQVNRSTPVAVSGGLNFQSISAGGSSTCGLTTGGAAYCWGFNSGLLGDGTDIGRLAPVAVIGGMVFQSVVAGGSSTCGVKVGGALYCWGGNTFGQVGDGGHTDRFSPSAVNPGLAFQSVSPGGLHVCGLLTGGAVVCWGQNGFGEIGDGTTTNRFTPTPVSQ